MKFEFVKNYLIFSIIYLLIAANVRPISAAIVINEVLNNPAGTEAGAEWIELYNTETSPATLNDCTLFLDSNISTIQKIIFGNADFVDKFKVISWDSSWLNNSGDTIKLDCGLFSDSVAYGNESGAVVNAPEDGVSFGRNPDGSGSYTILSSITLGEPNSPSPTSIPIPTNTNSPTPKDTPTTKPTLTPKPSTTPKPTSTPTIIPTSKPTNTVIPTQKYISPTITKAIDLDTNSLEDVGTDSGGVVQGVNVTGYQSGKINSENVNYDITRTKKNKFPLMALTFVLGGILILISALYPIIIKYINKIKIV
jgi:hypothetical protein